MNKKCRPPIAVLVALLLALPGAAGLGVIDPDVVLSCTHGQDGVIYDGKLALDADTNTCAKTCFGYGAWIKMKTGHAGKVNKVKLTGYLPQLTKIRIGNGTEGTKWMSGFENNAECVSQTAQSTHTIPGSVTQQTFVCSVVREGQVVSFQAGSVNIAPQLVVCDLQLSYDPTAVPA